MLKEALPEKLRLLFSVLHGSGLRIQALLDLRVQDITFEGEKKGKVWVQESKGGGPRQAVMDWTVLDEVGKWVEK